jgi:hypothetical protein
VAIGFGLAPRLVSDQGRPLDNRRGGLSEDDVMIANALQTVRARPLQRPSQQSQRDERVSMR